MKLINLFIIIISFFLSFFLISCTQKELVYEIPEFEIYFCPKDNCEEVMFNFIDSTKEELKCAFFELNLESLINLLKDKDIDLELLIDHRYKKYVLDLDFVKLINRSGLMHNKYCISDNKKILTGSTNPTNNCANKNYNNIIIFESYDLALKYLNNFDEIKNYNRPINSENFNPYVEVFFCPGDCIKYVSNIVREANKSIYFMTFAFTAKEIAIDIILKNQLNISVKGLFDRLSAGSMYSVVHMLRYQNIDIKIAQGQGKLHNKVFIIDNSTVITGSFNPSANANNRNYENIIVIRSHEIAQKYAKEFFYIYNKS